MTELNLWQ